MPDLSPIKALALRALTIPGATLPFVALLRNRATIFMLHRFRDTDRGVDGIDPVALEQGLAYLRRERYALLGLEALFRRLVAGAPLNRAVAFTIDDGYLEQATIAASVFARYECPATTFVTTGFLDGTTWFWWDKVEHVFLETRRHALDFGVDGRELRHYWQDPAGRRRAQAKFIEWCTRVPEAEKQAGIAALAIAADVEIPHAPPPRYRPMSWEQLRECERLGMRFGPHSVTHPILSRTLDEQCRRELAESWARLRAEASRPLAVFCYPHGGWDDFGPREIAVLEELGFMGAVAGGSSYADARVLRRDASERFKVPRFGYPEDLPHVIQCVAGVERLKQIVRGKAAA